jgi:hypothetical protein
VGDVVRVLTVLEHGHILDLWPLADLYHSNVRDYFPA